MSPNPFQPIPGVVPTAGTLQAEIETLLAQAKVAAQYAAQSIAEQIQSCLQLVDDTGAACSDCVRQLIEMNLQAVGALGTAGAAEVESQLLGLLGMAYEFALPLGCTFPTQETLDAGPAAALVASSLSGASSTPSAASDYYVPPYTPPYTPPTYCPPGQHVDPADPSQCVDDVVFGCPAGFHPDPEDPSRCIVDNVTVICDPGYHNDPVNPFNCDPDVPPPPPPPPPPGCGYVMPWGWGPAKTTVPNPCNLPLGSVVPVVLADGCQLTGTIHEWDGPTRRTIWPHLPTVSNIGQNTWFLFFNWLLGEYGVAPVNGSQWAAQEAFAVAFSDNEATLTGILTNVPVIYVQCPTVPPPPPPPPAQCPVGYHNDPLDPTKCVKDVIILPPPPPPPPPPPGCPPGCTTVCPPSCPPVFPAAAMTCLCSIDESLKKLAGEPPGPPTSPPVEVTPWEVQFPDLPQAVAFAAAVSPTAASTPGFGTLFWPYWGSLTTCADIEAVLSKIGTSDSQSLSHLLGFYDDHFQPVTPLWLIGVLTGVASPLLLPLETVSEYITSLTAFIKSVSPLEIVKQLTGVANVAGSWPGNPGINRLREQLDTWSNGLLSNALTAVRPLQPETDQQVQKPLIEITADLVAGILRNLCDTLSDLVKGWATASGCLSPAMLVPAIYRIVYAVIERWAGDVLPDVKTSLGYFANYLCPTEIPDPGAANDAYLAGQITEETWRCWTRAANQHELPARAVLLAGQQKLNPDEITRAQARGLLTPVQADQAMRALGYLDPAVIRTVYTLFDQIPGPSDLVQFMLRDVFDPAVVAELQTDDEFGEKFVGQAVPWAKAQGLSTDLMRFYWRAHWQIPSAQQIFEMLHRLRPGVVDPDLVMTSALAERILGINDMLPSMRKRMIAVSYRPLTRIDVRRAYDINAVSRDQLKGTYQDDGYTEDNAEILAKFADAEKVKHAAGIPLVKSYIAGHLPLATLRLEMTAEGYTGPVIDAVVLRAGVQIQLEINKACVEAQRQEYLSGAYADEEIVGALLSVGFAGDEASRLVAQWSCLRAKRARTITASELCKWHGDGLLAAADYATRLVRIGYSAVDASRIVVECEAAKQAKNAKDQEAAAKAKAAQNAKVQAEHEKAAKQTQAAAKQAATDQVKAEKSRQRTEKRLLSAVDYVVLALKLSETDATAAVQAAWSDLMHNHDQAPEFAAELVEVEAKGLPKDGSVTLSTRMADAIASLTTFAEPAEPLRPPL